MSEAIYTRAVEELFQHTYGKLEHDEVKVLQLFDKLLQRGLSVHADNLRDLCTNVGYDESTACHIGQLCEILRLIREKLDEPCADDHWPPELMRHILSSEIRGD